MFKIRKNHLTINDPNGEIYEIFDLEEDYVYFSGSQDDISGFLDYDNWECGDVVKEEVIFGT